jgi:hypothetical protein
VETAQAEPPRETLLNLLNLTGYSDPVESEPWSLVSPRLATAGELQAVSAEVDDLRRRLSELERVQGEMAALLAGMGIQVGIG